MNRHLGILGGGQLGRMLALAAHPLGIRVSAVDPQADGPVAAVAEQITAAYDDREALARLAQADYATFEFENVPDAAVKQLEESLPVAPPPIALHTAQDRLREKRLFQKLDIVTTPYRDIVELSDLEQAFRELGKLVLKTRTLGYDGKGQVIVASETQISAAFQQMAGVPAIAEQWVPFEREVSIIIVRDRKGNFKSYPLTENLHRSGVLHRSIAPAPNATELEAQAIAAAHQLANALQYVGVLAVEFFVKEGQLIANEYAPRVHNSGHWTIEGAETSQFQNHIRAVCDLPLGSTKARGHSVMLNLLGSIPERETLLIEEGAHLHDYGKQERAGRKVGHVTVVSTTAEQSATIAARLEKLIHN